MPRKRVIIVGGVAGGMSAAARLRRLSEDLEIVVFEKSGYVSYANCGLPYFLGREIEDEKKLVLQTPESLKARFNIDVRLKHEALSIDVKEKKVTVKNLLTNSVSDESFDDLVLSVGASAIKPDMPGISLPGIFTLRNIEDLQKIEKWIKRESPKQVVIAGGGYIGLEVAEQLTRRGLKVTVACGHDHVLEQLDTEMAAFVHEELRLNGVELLLNNKIEAFKNPDEISTNQSAPKCGWVCCSSNEIVPADMVILGVGVKPETTLAKKAGLTLGKLGGIRVNDHLQTSSVHVWAVGDAIEVKQPVTGAWALIALGGPANRQGRIVADNIMGRSATFDGTFGNAILRVFKLSVAMVGLNEAALQKSAVAFEAVYAHPTDHAGYFPKAERMHLKLLFSTADGKILGAQAVGKEGIDKRIDVIATAMKAGMTVRDLADLELAYAPPFGSSKDPVNLIAMESCNVLDGLVKQIQWHQLSKLTDVQILDVRSEEERSSGFIPNSINIPLPSLRLRLSELQKNKMVIPYCQSGQRSYFAYRFLQSSDIPAANLAGGYLTWSHSQAHK